MNTIRLTRCQAGEQAYMIDSELIDSIQPAEELKPDPIVAGSLGWVGRSDEQVPVFQLSRQIEGGSAASQADAGGIAKGAILALRRGKRYWGLLVDKVLSTTDVPKDRLFPLPAVVGAGPGFPCLVLDRDTPSLLVAPERLVPREVSGVLRFDPPPLVPAPAVPGIPPSAGPAGLDESGPRASARNRQMLTFGLARVALSGGQVRFAISVAQAVEIVSSLPMVAIPHAPRFVAGMAAWRGLPVPVIHLGGWLGISPPSAAAGSRLLLCRSTLSYAGRGAGVIALTEVEELQKVELPIEYASWPESVDWNPARALGIYQYDRGMLVVPDLDALLRFDAPLPAYLM